MLEKIDFEVYQAIEEEKRRQEENIELIASENFVSLAVLEAQGSIMTNKYAEGYPSKRYYGGCVNVDKVEVLAIERLKELFGAKYANVQPHSGSQANMGAYRAILKNGDVVMGMALDQGGHLTHGHKLNFSGVDYQFVPYFLNKETEEIDYEELRKQALEVKPALIVAGASAYSKEIKFDVLRKIADEVGCKLMVDMAHIAGLVAAGLHQNPVLYADIVFIVDQNVLAAILPTEFQVSLILPDQFLCIQSAVIHTVLYVAGMFFNITKVGFDIPPGHDQAHIADFLPVAFIKVLFPVKGYVTALYNEILTVLNGSLYHFPHDGPEITRQLIIIHGRQIRISAADQAHFQMIDGQIGIMVFLKHALGKERFPGMGCSAN